MIDYGVHLIYLDFPRGVRGTHTENEDGSFTIFINQNLSGSEKNRVYLHELAHIENNDLSSDESADIIELLRNAGYKI